MSKMVTLWCEEGQHNWYRQSQRGRKPINCPDHVPDTIEVKGDGLSPLDKARLVKQTRKNSEWEATKMQVDKVINHPRMAPYGGKYSVDARPSTVSTLKYLVQAIDNGRNIRPPHEIIELESMIGKILKDPYNTKGHLL